MFVKVNCFIAMTILVLFIEMTCWGSNQVKAQTYIDKLEDYWVQPVDGKITDTFGTRNGNHKGIDIAAPEGEKIVSVSSGKVTKSYYSDTYGHVVFVEHPEGYETVYAHLSKRMVSEGDTIKRGQTLGIIGNTGVSRGTHLHFELHKGEWTYDKEHALDPIFVFDSLNSSIQTKKGHSDNNHFSQRKHDSIEVDQNAVQKEVHAISVKQPASNQKKKAASQKKVITIQKGDTLWELSQSHKVSIKYLKEWNKLEGDFIYPGQQLTVYLTKDKGDVVQAGNTI